MSEDEPKTAEQIGVEFWGLEGYRNGATKRIALRRRYAVYRCYCGKLFIAMVKCINNRYTKSCGCWNIQRTSEMGKNSSHRIKHGMTKTREWSSWHMAKQRCFNPNATKYRNWGGRGVTMCDRWRFSFQNFFEDMGPRPEGTSLDRIDPFGNYEPSNCRWADISTQNRNTRKKKKNESSLVSNGS
jgi:hypothetical protein